MQKILCALVFMIMMSTASDADEVLLVSVAGTQLADATFWGAQCQNIPADALYVKLVMGNVIDYFKPDDGFNFCDMLTSSTKHLWSSEGMNWVKPNYFNGDDYHYGGSARDYPSDGREWLSFWGDENVKGGCGYLDYNDDLDWLRAFDMYYGLASTIGGSVAVDVSCIDDNSADAWLPSYSCEQLLGINWCVDKTYGKQTEERCPLTCGKCACGFGDHILEEACQCNGNACRKGEYCYNDGCKTTPNTNVPDCADARIVRSACKCADETICPAGTYCWDDQCQNEKYISECQSAGFISTPCQCGDAGLCGRNTYCYNNKCNTIPQKCSGYEVSPIPDVCICGGVVCSGGLHCWNGGAGDQCQIDAQPKECGDGGKNEATCMCGASKCSKGFYCWPGQICVAVPPTCGVNTDTAAISSECSCGGSSCGWGKFCVAGQCSETKKPSTPECELGEVATECICGGDECSNGEFCYNGMCNAKASSCAETPFLPLDYACDCGGILCDTSNYCYDGVCRNEPRAESCKSSAVEPLKETCHCGTAGECPKGDFCHQMECKKEPVGCKENAFQPVEEKCMCGSVECTGYCFDGECEDQPRPECKSGLVVANNWPKHWKEEGMYFAVDDALAQKFFKSTNWSSNEKDIINSRGYRGKIKVWKNSKNCGNCGRYHPWAEKQAGDWQVGDIICDDPQNVPIQPTAAPHPIEECKTSLQATHGHPGNYLGKGKYFGFDNKCANKFFGTTQWHNKKVTVMVKTGKNAFKPAKIHLFKDGPNCKMSCARWEPNSLSKEGDWNLNDLIFHAPTNLPEHPIEKCDAELLVTYNYPGLYKAEGQFMTFDNECMKRFVKKENFHWKKLTVIVNGDYSNTRVIRVLKDSSLCGHKSCGRIEPIGDSSAMDWKSGDILRLPSCDFKNGGCNENASCSVVKKKMSCKCKSGFAGDGYLCAADKTLTPHPIELCKTSLQVLDNWPSKWGKEGQFFAFDSKCMDVFYGSSKWDWKKMMVSAPDGSEVKVVFFKNKAGGSNKNVCGGTPCGRIDPKDNSASGDWPWGSYVNHIDHGLVPQTTEQCQSQLQITGIRPVDFEQEGKWFEFENDCMTAFFGTESWRWEKFSITVNGETREVAFFKNLEMCGMKSCGRVDPKGAAKAGDWSMGNVLLKTDDYDYYLVDGAPLNGILIPTKKTMNPNTQLAEVQCCKTDESDCTRRDPWNSSSDDDCISGNHDAVKYNYFEAESLCQNIEPKGQWDLCQKELIESTKPKICERKGCFIDHALTWTKRTTQDIFLNYLNKDEQALSKESTVGKGTTQTSLGSHMSTARFLAICTVLGGVVVFGMMMKKEKSEESHPLLETI